MEDNKNISWIYWRSLYEVFDHLKHLSRIMSNISIDDPTSFEKNSLSYDACTGSSSLIEAIANLGIIHANDIFKEYINSLPEDGSEKFIKDKKELIDLLNKYQGDDDGE